MYPPYGWASRLSSGGGRLSAGSGHSSCCTTVVTGAVPSEVGSSATRTSMFPLLELKYDNTALPSICLKLISPTRSPHSGVGDVLQPPSGPDAQPCQWDLSPKFSGATRYSTAGWLRSKLSATMYTQPVCDVGVGIGS